MKIESQVSNLELSRKIKYLNCKQESAFYWETSDDKLPILVTTNEAFTNDELEYFSAFTVAELGVLLNRNVNDISWHRLGWRIWWDIGKEDYFQTEADARASKLIYLIEKGIVKP